MTAKYLPALLTTLLAVAAPPPVAAAARQPNVVLIMVDDLGYQDLGCYGHPSIRTPVLDRLAGDGIRLTDFHAGATVCTPSRMALLTGAYPTRIGWTRGVVGFKMGMDDGMSPEALTIAEIFRSEGYATAISGKWHLGRLPANRPHRQGFDSAYYLDSSNNQTRKIWRGDEVVEDPFDNRRLTQQFTAEGIRFIREQRDSPFFLYLPYTVPHFPVQPHPEWQGRSGYGKYGDAVEELDTRIGELLATLRELELDRQTIVVFCSDNGPNPGEMSGCLPFRGEKWSALEGGTRVPCIITWPGVVPPGRTSDALVSALDLLPTLCRACGIDWQGKSRGKPKIDGLDVWDTVLGKGGTHPRAELLYWHGMDPEPQAIRVGDYKLFFDRRNALDGLGTARITAAQAARVEPYRTALKPQGTNPPILFNLRDDPGETIDLSERFPDKVEALGARAKALMAEIKAAGILPISTPDPKDKPAGTGPGK
jgi:arylsulfatase A-like enzyme